MNTNTTTPTTRNADCDICQTVTAWTLGNAEGHEYYTCDTCGIADLGAWNGQLQLDV